MDGMNRIARVIERINYAAAIITGLLILIICILSSYEAIARTFFNSPTRWTSSISVFLMIFAIFLGSAYCFQKEGHIRIEIVLDRLKNRAKRYLLLTGYLVSLVAVLVLGWKGFELTSRSLALNWQTLTTIQVPIGYVNIAIPLGCLLMVLALSVKIWEQARKDIEND